MKAYKCDVCGKYFDDVYSNDGNTFDIFPGDANELGIGNKHIHIRDMCTDCYKDIRTFIHNKYLENH